MNQTQFREIEKYMLASMADSAHDCQHIYRVLYTALDIAAHENGVDIDILIAACLLHDIGRKAQFANPALCHAKIGSEMAYDYLLSIGWEQSKARHVAGCIGSHRFRGEQAPRAIEAKILFDADKLEAAGAIGIARTFIYQGQVAEPLYAVDGDGNPLLGIEDDAPSFFREYNYKLKHVYGRFYTKRGDELAQARQAAAERFYHSLVDEVQTTIATGKTEMAKYLS